MYSRENVRAWLQSKHCTMWQTFNIQDEQGIEAAIDFVIGLTRELARSYVSRETPPDDLDEIRARSQRYNGDGANPPWPPTVYCGTSTPITAQS